MRVLLCGILLLSLYRSTVVFAAAGTRVIYGTDGGAAYRIEVPARWNGTLLLYSHGYVFPGVTAHAADAPDAASAGWLLEHGYALAGSSYGPSGWAVADALRAQMRLLNVFARRIGQPRRTIAWGQSMGGLITVGLLQRNPGRFDAALPMCGVLGGATAIWNAALDGEFVFDTLLARNVQLQLTHITDPLANLAAAQVLLAAAQASAQGRARLALMAAISDVPGWFDGMSAPPAPTDFNAQEQAQLQWDGKLVWPLIFAGRADLEQRAGGNPSWNTGVDYTQQLARSIDRAEVLALYGQAGLNLANDLQLLQRAPRVRADPVARTYLRQNIDLNGRLSVPVLTLHTTTDGLVSVQNEQDFARVTTAAGRSTLLRQLFVQRAGHCWITPAEKIAALQQLVYRLDTGRWELLPAALNGAAARLGSSLNVSPPAFVRFTPSVFLRPEDR